MTVRIDTERVFNLVEEKRPARVILNAPGGLLRQTMDLMQVVEKKYVDLGRMQWVAVGDREQIEDVLKKYGRVTVVDTEGKPEN